MTPDQRSGGPAPAAAAGTAPSRIDFPKPTRASAMEASPDGNWLAVGTSFGDIYLADTRDGTFHRCEQHRRGQHRGPQLVAGLGLAGLVRAGHVLRLPQPAAAGHAVEPRCREARDRRGHRRPFPRRIAVVHPGRQVPGLPVQPQLRSRSTTDTPSTCPSPARSSPTSWPWRRTRRRPSAPAWTLSVEAGRRSTDSREGPRPASGAAVRVDAEGLAHRVISVPVPQGNYSALTATDGALLWLDSALAGVTGDGRASLEDKNAAPEPGPLRPGQAQDHHDRGGAGQLPALRRRQEGGADPGQADPRGALRRQGRRGIRPAGQGGPRPHPRADGSAAASGARPSTRHGGCSATSSGPRTWPARTGSPSTSATGRWWTGSARTTTSWTCCGSSTASWAPRTPTSGRPPSPRTAATARAASAPTWRSPARAGRSPASSPGNPRIRWPRRR